MNEVEDAKNVRRFTGRIEAMQGYTIQISIVLIILEWVVSSITGYKLFNLLSLIPLFGIVS